MRHRAFSPRKRRARLFRVHETWAKRFLGDPVAMQPTRQMAIKVLQRQVRDPALRAKLTTTYAIGCRRLLISRDHCPKLSKARVKLVTDPSPTSGAGPSSPRPGSALTLKF
jgi:cation diffusion facilitator CzcD-associated flavoprotein CzcO